MLPLVELICVGTVTTCSPTFWVLHNLDFLSPNSDLLDILPQPMQKTSLLLEPNQTHSTNPEPTQWIFSRIYSKFHRILLPSNLWHWSRLCPRQWKRCSRYSVSCASFHRYLPCHNWYRYGRYKNVTLSARLPWLCGWWSQHRKKMWRQAPGNLWKYFL